MARRAFVLMVTIGLFAALAAACGDDGGYGDGDGDATATEGSAPTAPPVTEAPSSEAGEEPVFWRTLDNFQSVRVGEPYKAVLRVTNGYNADTLTIEAASNSGAATLTFEAMRVDAPGEDKGTFYTVNLEFPRQGRYAVTFIAGPDEVSTDVDVAAGASEPAG